MPAAQDRRLQFRFTIKKAAPTTKEEHHGI
jgi:hypothetical protein